MICYRCGMEAGDREDCPVCGADLTLFWRMRRISNTFYNEGLKAAGVRNLSAAVESLKQSLRYNKYNTNARNLLGLVYYEMGEMVEALSEWVISTSFAPQDNRAFDYLKEVSSKQQLENSNQVIRKYNQAIAYCRQGNRDLAIIQLKKVLTLSKRMVKAHQLLGLLYMEEGQPEKAVRVLRDAARIDTNNTTTMRYLKEAGNQVQEAGRRKKSTDALTYQSGNETIILPRKKRDRSALSGLLCLLAGIALGVGVTAFLVVPGIRSAAKDQTQQQLVEASDTIATNAQTIEQLQAQVESMEAEVVSANNKEEKASSRLAAYQDLLDAYVTYTTGDLAATGRALEEVDESCLKKAAKKAKKNLETVIYEPYMEELYQAALVAFSKQDYDTAIEKLLEVTGNDESYEDGWAAYYLAESYRRSDRSDQAQEYYTYVYENYGSTERGKTAKAFLGIVDEDTGEDDAAAVGDDTGAEDEAAAGGETAAGDAAAAQ